MAQQLWRMVRYFKSLKMELLCEPATALLGVDPKEMKFVC